MLTNQFANQTESGSVIGEHLRVSLMAGRLPLGSRSAGPPAREPISPQLERFPVGAFSPQRSAWTRPEL